MRSLSRSLVVASILALGLCAALIGANDQLGRTPRALGANTLTISASPNLGCGVTSSITILNFSAGTDGQQVSLTATGGDFSSTNQPTATFGISGGQATNIVFRGPAAGTGELKITASD